MAEGKYQIRCEVIKPSGTRGALFQFEDMTYEDVIELEAAVMPILAQLAKEKASVK